MKGRLISTIIPQEEYDALLEEAMESGEEHLLDFVADLLRDLLQQRRAQQEAWDTSPETLALIEKRARVAATQTKEGRVWACQVSEGFDVPHDIDGATAYVEANWADDGNGPPVQARKGGECPGPGDGDWCQNWRREQ